VTVPATSTPPDATAEFFSAVVLDGRVKLVRQALDQFLDDPARWLAQSDAIVVALAASELVAIVIGKPPPNVDPSLPQWGSGWRARRLKGQCERARAVVTHIQREAQAGSLWHDFVEDIDWFEAIEDLITRLGGPADVAAIAPRPPPSVAEKVVALGLPPPDGGMYMVYADKVMFTPMGVGLARGVEARLVAKLQLELRDGWLYFVDKDGDVARTPVGR
jgi:hypothetical protein